MATVSSLVLPRDVHVASSLPSAGSEAVWCLESLRGRFVELRGAESTATLTCVAGLMVEAQRCSELVAWIGNTESIFFPPDFAATGIDVAAVPVVRARSVIQAAQVADSLLRSGGFALVVLDFRERGFLPLQVQTRLVGLAKKHHTGLLAITRGGEGETSLGSLISLRAETEKQRTDFDRFTCTIRVSKDKQRGPGWEHREVCCGAFGLC